MDLQGVERRVGAKTRFEDVRLARVLRIARRAGQADGDAKVCALSGCYVLCRDPTLRLCCTLLLADPTRSQTLLPSPTLNRFS